MDNPRSFVERFALFVVFNYLLFWEAGKRSNLG